MVCGCPTHHWFPQQLVPSNPTLAGDFRRWMPHLVNSDGGSKSSNIMSHGEPFGCPALSPALSAGVPGDAGTRANGEVVGGHCGVLDPHGQQHHGAGGPLWSRVTALWTGSRPNYSKFTCCFFFQRIFSWDVYRYGIGIYIYLSIYLSIYIYLTIHKYIDLSMSIPTMQWCMV